MALRDDSNKLSLSLNEHSFTRNCALNGNGIVRQDGRGAGEIRKLRLTFSRSHARSECTVELGNTKCLCAIAADLIPPNPDRANNGILNFQVDLSPMASLSYDAGLGSADSHQRLLSTKLGRVMERTIREGNALDTEALCVQSGKWVWNLNADVTVLDDSGNVLDAALLAVVSALRHFRLPEVAFLDDDTPMVLHSDDKEPTPLPLHHTPVCITFGLFGDPTGAAGSSKVAAILDPSNREQLVMDGSITFAFNRHKELCTLDFNGGCELRTSQLLGCAKLAEKKGSELCVTLEESLKNADSQARQDRLERLKATTSLKPATMLGSHNIPYLEKSDDTIMEVQNLESVQEIGEALAKAAAEDEKYRLQALDYDLGHVAAKVKDIDNQRKQSVPLNGGGSLIEAMINSAISKDTECINTKQNGDISSTSDNSRQTRPTQIARDSTNNSKSEAIDSDEEETTVLNPTEFSVTPMTNDLDKVKKTTLRKDIVMDDDIDDLLQAVKKTKPKKKKKSKDKL